MEDEPDPRWSLANERTLLAYERTALGLLVGGIGIAGSYVVTDAPRWVVIIGIPLIVLGAIIAVAGRHRFLEAEQAMRTGAPLPRPISVSILPAGVTVVAVLALILVVAELL